jgi:hypothetical protein
MPCFLFISYVCINIRTRTCTKNVYYIRVCTTCGPWKYSVIILNIFKKNNDCCAKWFFRNTTCYVYTSDRESKSQHLRAHITAECNGLWALCARAALRREELLPLQYTRIFGHNPITTMVKTYFMWKNCPSTVEVTRWCYKRPRNCKSGTIKKTLRP